ncbi:hypothetical protein C6370_20485 [Bacillus atrophaeus]|uniref:UPF0715 family protein n=1 Tax=Bacillus atrophaeus TaxID=1452 RepID=UPI000D0816D7|nr:UPF0715 family protein [Bacillus atrophaeus]PSA89339.1 hypothetical protein C6370_20485 [Bacillus atrophaeus]
MRVIRYLCVLVLSAMTGSLVMNIVYVGNIPFAFFSMILFGFYSIFATPVQVFLNRKPKRLHLKYLVIYITCSFVVWFIFAVLTDKNICLLKEYDIYLFSISFALIFWIWDSVFLQTAS